MSFDLRTSPWRWPGILFAFALLWPLLAMQATAEVPTQLAGKSLADFPYFHYIRSIGEDQEVRVALDPNRFPELMGQTVDLLLVNDRSRTEWDLDPWLVDVRPSGPQSITITGSTIQDNSFDVASPFQLYAGRPDPTGSARRLVGL